MEFHPSKNVKTPIIITYSKIRQLSHGKKTNGNLQNGQIRTALDTPYISGSRPPNRHSPHSFQGDKHLRRVRNSAKLLATIRQPYRKSHRNMFKMHINVRFRQPIQRTKRSSKNKRLTNNPSSFRLFFLQSLNHRKLHKKRHLLPRHKHRRTLTPLYSHPRLQR